MNIAIAGAGWYGCHIASTLKGFNATVKIFEKNNDIFLESSSNNQFRLHQGLHYARSSLTRHQSRDGFLRFSERYPAFSKPISENYYLVPKYESLIDFGTYFSIMFSSGIDIEKCDLNNLKYLDKTKFEGMLKCSEKILLNNKAKDYFSTLLQSNLYTNTKITNVEEIDNKVLVNNEPFDYLIDATWGALENNKECYYESTLLLYYETDIEFPAITLVDGNLWSIYPTETEGLYTLSSVTHTPLGTYDNKDAAYSRLNSISTEEINAIRQLMEAQVIEYFPTFNEYFRFKGPQFSTKTKPIGKVDNRHASVVRNNNIFRINSGKVDNIFHASDYILGQIFT